MIGNPYEISTQEIKKECNGVVKLGSIARR